MKIKMWKLFSVVLLVGVSVVSRAQAAGKDSPTSAKNKSNPCVDFELQEMPSTSVAKEGNSFIISDREAKAILAAAPGISLIASGKTAKPLTAITVEAMQPIKINLLLQNGSKTPFTTVTTNENWDYSVEVKDSCGNRVPLTRFGRGIGQGPSNFYTYSTENLLPGQKLQNVLLLNRIVDLTIADTYSVVIGRTIVIKGRLVNVKSKPFKITVDESFGIFELLPR